MFMFERARGARARTTHARSRGEGATTFFLLSCSGRPRAMLSTLSCAAKLAQQGFAVVPQQIISPDHALRLKGSCCKRLASLLDTVDDMGYDPIEQSYQFSEVCHRQRLRWDVRPTFDDDEANKAWENMCASALEAATPIICDAIGEDADALSPRLVMSGAVISRPGCAAQRFHADGSELHYQTAASDPHHRLFTCFVPLVDVASDGDGTEFFSGSHHGDGLAEARRSIAPDGTLHADAAASVPLEAPGCAAGQMLMFDYRVIHVCKSLGTQHVHQPCILLGACACARRLLLSCLRFRSLADAACAAGAAIGWARAAGRLHRVWHGWRVGRRQFSAALARGRLAALRGPYAILG